MFDQIKDLYKLKQQAAEMQKQLNSTLITGESSDKSVTIIINGNHDLVDIKISESLNNTQTQENIKQAYSNAQSQLKNLLVQKFQGML